MAAPTVKCAKLGQDLPGLDPATPAGERALKVALLIGGPEMRDKIQQRVSARAWEMWTDHMRMVMNEFRLDPMSDEANRILKRYMEEFFFGTEAAIPNYVPPDRKTGSEPRA
jgi:Fe-S cluster biosynthesis and repair protein YggX